MLKLAITNPPTAEALIQAAYRAHSKRPAISASFLAARALEASGDADPAALARLTGVAARLLRQWCR